MRFIFSLSLFLLAPFSVASSVTEGTYSCTLDEADGDASTFTITEEALILHSSEATDEVYTLGLEGDDHSYQMPSEKDKEFGIEYFRYKIYYINDRTIKLNFEIKYVDSANLDLGETIITEAEAGTVMTFMNVTNGPETTKMGQLCRLEE